MGERDKRAPIKKQAQQEHNACKHILRKHKERKMKHSQQGHKTRKHNTYTNTISHRATGAQRRSPVIRSPLPKCAQGYHMMNTIGRPEVVLLARGAEPQDYKCLVLLVEECTEHAVDVQLTHPGSSTVRDAEVGEHLHGRDLNAAKAFVRLAASQAEICL